MWQRILTVAFFCGLWSSGLIAAETESENDSSAVLPKEYSDKYLIASETVSPDKKFAVIYPKVEVCFDEGKDVLKDDCKDYLVALQPFQILCALETKRPHFENKNHGRMSAIWSKDSAVVLVTLDSKWGPGDIFLYELRDGRLSRSTNLLGEIRRPLERDFRKSRADPYNDFYDFIFRKTTYIGKEEIPLCQIEGTSRIRVNATATTDPKNIPGERAWEGRLEGVWDIPQGKLTSQKVTRLFAGVRKKE
jgi:hypothetical protein